MKLSSKSRHWKPPIIQTLVRFYIEQGFCNWACIYKSFAQIVIKKIIDIINKGSSADSKITVTAKSDFLNAAQQYCIENYEKNITVYDIAQYVGVHPNYLSSAFKKHFGITIIQYLNICRLKHATNLINNKKVFRWPKYRLPAVFKAFAHLTEYSKKKWAVLRKSIKK